MECNQKTSSLCNQKGEFIRKPSTFRKWISPDGEFQPEADRYHLYVSLACPWACRALVVRNLKGLQAVFPYTVVDWHLVLDKDGWTFTDQKPKCSLDTVNHCKNMRGIYQLANPDYDGRFTIPVLWDKKTRTIVNNESSEIIRMMNSQFNALCSTPEQRDLDLYPPHLQKAIDEVNEWVYPEINNGVYRCGFATTQEAYNSAVTLLFKALDKVESLLSRQRYLTGDTFTESDVRLFTTLIRFDSVYVGHFKCNLKQLAQYPSLWAYTREIYQMPGVAETVDFEHIKKHYYGSHLSINPLGIVPMGPILDLQEPHGREKLDTK